jgi:hypothetical protein
MEVTRAGVSCVQRLIYPCNRPWRPIELWDVEAPIFCLDNRLTDGGKFVSPTRRPPFDVKSRSISFLVDIAYVTTTSTAILQTGQGRFDVHLGIHCGFSEPTIAVTEVRKSFWCFQLVQYSRIDLVVAASILRWGIINMWWCLGIVSDINSSFSTNHYTHKYPIFLNI